LGRWPRGALLVGLSWASALRGRLHAKGERAEVALTALHVQPSSRGTRASSPTEAVETELEPIRRVADTWSGVSVKGETSVNANVTQGIADYVRDSPPDLIVMGTRGLGLDAVGRLGSVAASVMNAVDVPVLLVPPAVWMEHARVP
jgi:nucleotide-binding universal stress UspA family protein